MSYGLRLWRQTGPFPLTWDELWTAFDEGKALDFITPLSFLEIERALRRYFPQIDAEGHQINWEGDGSYFQLDFTYQSEREISSIQYSGGFSLPPKTLERFFDFAWELKLSVYDGQGPTFFLPIGSAVRPATWLDRLRRRKWDIQKA